MEPRQPQVASSPTSAPAVPYSLTQAAHTGHMGRRGALKRDLNSNSLFESTVQSRCGQMYVATVHSRARNHRYHQLAFTHEVSSSAAHMPLPGTRLDRSGRAVQRQRTHPLCQTETLIGSPLRLPAALAYYVSRTHSARPPATRGHACHARHTEASSFDTEQRDAQRKNTTQYRAGPGLLLRRVIGET